MTEELKPCPFCGSPAKQGPQDAVNCTNADCDASVYVVGIDTWNRRASVVTDELVERSARAISKSLGEDPDAVYLRPPMRKHPLLYWHKHRVVAAVALRAVLEMPQPDQR